MYGRSVHNDFSFNNRVVKATFGFTLEILELLGRVNTVFQKPLCTVSETWNIIMSLKTKIASLIMEPRIVDSNERDSFNGLSENEVQESNCFETTVHCLGTRFQFPSTSTDEKRRQNSLTSFQLLHEQTTFKRPSCSVLSIVEFTSIHTRSFIRIHLRPLFRSR